MIVGPFPFDAPGGFSFGGRGPAVPESTELSNPWWVPDTAGPEGFAASDAIRRLTW